MSLMDWIGLALCVSGSASISSLRCFCRRNSNDRARLCQFAFYFAVLVLLAKPLGAFMAAVYAGQRTFLTPVFDPLERLIYRMGGVDEDGEQDWKRYLVGRAARQPGRFRRRLSPCSDCRAYCRSIPRALRACQPGLFVQYGGELRHQYQLAGVRRRNDHELSHADARPGGAELPVGRHRHGRARRADSRLRAPSGGRDRQLLGGSHAQHALHPAAAVARARDRAGVARRRAELRAVPDGDLSSRRRSRLQ